LVVSWNACLRSTVQWIHAHQEAPINHTQVMLIKTSTSWTVSTLSCKKIQQGKLSSVVGS
jgi:hypothetical protein